MTNPIEINEDNCVLNQKQLNTVKEMIGICCFQDAKYWKNADMIWAKINKLNDLATVKEMIGVCCVQDAKYWKNANMIWAKTNKLNDLAKEVKKDEA